MTNKIEILRAICFTKEDMNTIKNLGDSFSEIEIDFMVEFKKIYELGLGQLQKFIDKLDKEGKDLDTYSILYYVETLLNGPLGSYVKEFSKDNKYFTNTPDCMGMLGNKTKSPYNNTIFENVEYQLGCSVDSYNKLPGFMQLTVQDSVKITEDVFRSSLKSTSEHDNTLPIIDKNNQKRYEEEKDGKWVLRANGSYMVKDASFYHTVNDISEDVFNEVETLLGEENFRLYQDKKQYTPFDSEKNESTATNNKIEKEFVNGEDSEILNLDIMGDEFDSEEKRSSKLIIPSDTKDKEYLLNSNEGQLGA